MRLLSVSLASLLLLGCSAPGKSRAALQKAGFTQIEIVGPGLWGCSKDDTFNTRFRAQGPTGNFSQGNVCCGLMKGCTIRF